ncbi:MAG TPA: phospholipase A [Opitutaceae bacterium]
MKKVFVAILFAFFSVLARGNEVVVSFVQAKVDNAATLTVQLLAANTGASSTSFTFPASLDGKISSGNQSWVIQLTRSQDGAVTLAPGAFATRSYSAVAPSQATGRLVMEVDKGLPETAIASVAQPASPESVANSPSKSAETTTAPSAITAASRIERTFAGRIAPHEPIYFIYGTHAPSAKFQFSFKYELAHFGASTPTYVPDTLQFAYTQRSLWDIRGNSSPFYDTSYMPELIFESLTPARQHDQSAWFTFLGYQTAVRHESNGRAGDTSRSLNTAYFQPLFAIGPLDTWHLILAPEVFDYIGGLSDNPDLPNYRGYGQLRAILARNNGPSLMLTAIPGRGFHKHTLQWDLTVPVHVPVIDWRTYLLFQYFDGYGESLLHYDQKARLFRVGVSFVR